MKKKRDYHILAFVELFVLTALFVFIFSLKSFYPALTGFTIYESVSDGSTINDSYLREASADNNYGTSITLRVGVIAEGTEYRALIRDFNISSIPSENTITDAKLQVYVNQSFGESNLTIRAYRVTSNWVESEASWNNRTFSNTWASAGGDYSLLITEINITNQSGVYYNFTLTSLVRGWVNGSYTNYGLILISYNAEEGNYTYFASANETNINHKPRFIIDYTPNAAPTIDAITTDSSLSSPKQIGESVNISVNWTDLEGNQGKLFVCNSSGINQSGCNKTTFCNTSFESTSPSSCLYNVQSTDNRTTNFWVSVCDSNNCSTINQSQFYMNHKPTALATDPNGGETVNQSLGNYQIEFNVSDSDSDLLTAKLYYSPEQNSTTNLIASINLTQNCTDSDSDTSTANNCSYSWNSTNVYGTYFLTIIINDSFSISNDSSDSSFNARSLIDTSPPNITAQWIESDIYSGKQIQIYANITEPFLNTAWVSINTTPQTNLTMGNTSATEYNITWTATSVGNYEFKVWANDTVGNLNNSMPWQIFEIRKPNATSQNETAPSTALPFHTIKIETKLNATDSLRDVYAYLNTPSGFTFLSNYSQNLFLGNFTSNQTKTATWFVSVPITEATYSVNVTYTDYYSNEWNSSNMQIQVTSAIGGYEISMTSYPEVETGGTYFAQAYFKQNGIYTNPDSITITVYDATGSSTWGPTSMTQESTGVYNYTNTIGSSVTEGQWEAIVNATKSLVSYYTHEFWKVTGGPFDVRTITIVDSSITGLNISVILENTGGANKDMVITWNLTREDTNTILDSGSETVMVPANTEKLYSISPSTTYVGQSKITFLGYYGVGFTEKAGAYRTFSTTSGVTPTPPPSGGGGGGGAIITEKNYDITIDVEETIYLTRNIKKIIYLTIKNTGKKSLNNLKLEIDLEQESYSIFPAEIKSLEPGETEIFEIKFLLKELIEKEINYQVESDELTKKQTGKIIVLPMVDYLKKETEYLEKRIQEIKDKTTDKKLLGELEECEDILNTLKSDLEKEEFINAENNLDKAETCIKDVEDKLEEEFALPEFKMNYVWAITWALLLILIIALAIIIYILYRKFNTIEFFKKQQSLKPTPLSKKQYFDDKIKQIEGKLK